MKNILLFKKQGFAMIAAVLAILVLTAVGTLVFIISTKDIRISSKIVGGEKALIAAEAGVHDLMLGFNPYNPSASAVGPVTVNASNDPASEYTISAPQVPQNGPAKIPLSGYAIGGGENWGSMRFVASVTGTNTRYSSNVQVDSGVGFGPVELTTTYR